MKYLSLLLLVLIVPVVAAQPPNLQLETESTIFRYDSTRQLWEWAYSFPDTALIYTQRDGQSVGQMYFRVTVKDEMGGLVKNEEWIVANTLVSTGDTNVRNLIGVKQFALAPGRFLVDCVVADMANRKDSLSQGFAIVIPASVNDKLALSEVQLASSITSAQESDKPVYVKGPVTVVPNPSAEYIVAAVPEDDFSSGIVVPYYFEVYNAKTFSPSGIVADISVLDSERRPVMSFTQKHNVPADGFAIYGNLPLENLATGTYYFVANIHGTDAAAADSVMNARKFFVLNAEKLQANDPFLESQAFAISEFATLGPERIEEEYEKILPLLPSHEQEKYQALTDDLARRKFLYRFWKAMDPDYETPENQAREEFNDRINYADKYFTTMQKKSGWRTDRGRVLRQYGKPDKIDVSPYSPEAKPYAVWHYYSIQGGVQFCFVEMNGLDYMLVHSTAKNEVSEPQWYKRFAEIMGAAQFHR